MIQSNKRLILIIAAILSIILPISSFVFFVTTPRGEGKNVRIIDFADGLPLKKFAGGLEKEGIISNARLFLILARVQGADSKVKAGSYQLNDGLSPAEILRKMVAGDTFAYRFAVPEGYSIFQIAELLEGRGLFKKDAFLGKCRDQALLKELGINGRSVEGYLYPSTYTIPPNMDEADFIRMMVKHFDKVYAERFAGRINMTEIPKLAIITLASIIEKEAAVPEERPLIASVFKNRLKMKMPLQSDPTAVYGERAFGGKVTREDIQRKNPYNTYQFRGLPPGPIGNPGGDSIEAAIASASSGYLYFVAKKDGTHYFSRTLEEHNRAVKRYLKN